MSFQTWLALTNQCELISGISQLLFLGVWNSSEVSSLMARGISRISTHSSILVFGLILEISWQKRYGFKLLLMDTAELGIIVFIEILDRFKLFVHRIGSTWHSCVLVKYIWKVLLCSSTVFALILKDLFLLSMC